MIKKITRIALIFVGILFFTTSSSLAQNIKNTVKRVTIVGVIDPLKTKSGYKINDYYMELTDSQANKLKDKQISVTGQLLIVKAIDPKDSIIVQGSSQNRKFIIKPTIKIIEAKRK